MAKPIALFGGSFNPVHHGHLRSALDICQALNLSQVTLMPTYLSPHKIAHSHQTLPGIDDGTHRLAMLHSAVDNCPQLTVSDYEIKQRGISYTADTIAYFRRQHPTSPLFFLMGMDSLINFTRWHRWQDILAQCHLVVSHRPGYCIEHHSQVKQLLKQYQTDSLSNLHHQLGGRIYLHQAHPLAISSSSIRNLVANHHAITYLTPAGVESYIVEHGLYGAP